MTVRLLLVLLALLSACTEAPKSCEGISKDAADKAVKACLQGEGDCYAGDQRPGDNFAGQVDLEHYRSCAPTARFEKTEKTDHSVDYIYRCNGTKYDAEIRAQVLNVPSEAFGCVITKVNFFDKAEDIPVGRATYSLPVLN